MKILLAGASGLLGSAFAKAAARRKHEIVGLVGKFSGRIEGLAEKRRIDLLDRETTEKTVLEIFPDAIVNCAAFAYPDKCADQPEISQRLNVDLPEQLAMLARHLFATLIHISSEQVFDGRKPPYRNADPVSITNRYARQKAESETRVHDMATEFATTLRIPLLNGNSPTGLRSLHEMLLAKWSRGESTPLFIDEKRQVCLADNAAEVMVELCERNDLKGIFHWAGSECLSRYEIGARIASHFGLPGDHIIASKRADRPEFANRQPDLSLDLSPLAGIVKTRPQTLDEQLDALIIPPDLRSWYHSA